MSVSKLDICVPPLLSDTALLWSMAFWHLDRSFVADQDLELCKEKLACTSTEVQHQPLSKIGTLKKRGARCRHKTLMPPKSETTELSQP